LETRPPPEGGPAREAATVESRVESSPPEPQGTASTGAPPDITPIAAKADDLEAIKKAVDDAAAVGGGLWLSYLFVLFYLVYLAIAAGAVTHEDLFFEKPVKLPFLGVELPLLAFFFLAPILFIIVHAYTLVHLVMLTEKTKRYHRALHDSERNVTQAERENLQWQLPSNIFVQFLAGPGDIRESWFGWLLRAIARITLVIAPVLLLLLIQIQFLPFHSIFITWTHRVVLVIDLILVWWLWRKILSRRGSDGGSDEFWIWPALGAPLTLGIILFSWAEATFPGEWQDNLPNHSAFWLPFPKPDRELVTLNRLVFQSDVDLTTRRRWLPLSNTLVLPGLNVYEGLGIDDPDKVKWHDFVFRARGRDLSGALIEDAVLQKVDFEGANLQGANFFRSQLQGASLVRAKLQNANFLFSQLQGAVFHQAQLQGATLQAVQGKGADFATAQLQGANLEGADLKGASLAGAQLQGATLSQTALQGAQFDNAKLQGTIFALAQLQGASFQLAILEATDLSYAFLWRSDGGGPSRFFPNLTTAADVKSIQFVEAAETWNPAWFNLGRTQSWTEPAYQDLLKEIEAIPSGDLRTQALDRIRRLDCASSDPNVAPCDATSPPQSETAAWRISIESARVDGATYCKALATTLKTLLCSGNDDSPYILHQLANQPVGTSYTPALHAGYKGNRLAATGAEAPALIDYILSKNCPASASLTDTDRARLLEIKQEVMKHPGA
jgi:uncharacterized protein YjbI with pentapeptide repeats